MTQSIFLALAAGVSGAAVLAHSAGGFCKICACCCQHTFPRHRIRKNVFAARSHCGDVSPTGAFVAVIDVGINSDAPLGDANVADNCAVHDAKVARGTADFRKVRFAIWAPLPVAA